MAGAGLPFWVEWIVVALALYGVSHLVVAAARRMFRLANRGDGTVHYLLWTSDSAEHVEYWLRFVRWGAMLNGRDYRIFWRDEGSGDETAIIVTRMMARAAQGESEEGLFAFSPPDALSRAELLAPSAVLLDLRKGEKLSKVGMSTAEGGPSDGSEKIVI